MLIFTGWHSVSSQKTWKFDDLVCRNQLWFILTTLFSSSILNKNINCEQFVFFSDYLQDRCYILFLLACNFLTQYEICIFGRNGLVWDNLTHACEYATWKFFPNILRVCFFFACIHKYVNIFLMMQNVCPYLHMNITLLFLSFVMCCYFYN